MQTSYYLLNGKNKLGPFSYDQLKDQEITDKYMVWKEGMETWENASELPELGSLIRKTPSVPPLTPNEQKRIQDGFAFNIAVRRSILWLIIVTLIGFIIGGGLASNDYLEETYNLSSTVSEEVSKIRWVLIPVLSVLLIALPLTIVIAYFKYQLNRHKESKHTNHASNSVNEVAAVMIFLVVVAIFIAFVILNGDYRGLARNVVPFVPWSTVPISILLYKWFYYSYSKYGKSPLSWLLISPKE